MNFWMLRGYSRFRLGLLSGDWRGVQDMVIDYRSALDLGTASSSARSGPMPTFVMERFAQEVQPVIQDLVNQTRNTLDDLTEGVREVRFLEKTVYGAPFGIAKVMKNNSRKQQARALLEEVIPVVGNVHHAIQVLGEGFIATPGLARFEEEVVKQDNDLRSRFQDLAARADDTTMGDLIWGKWSRRFRS